MTVPGVEPRLGLGVTLIGVDGSTWDLFEGPVRLLSGSTGFGTVPPEHWWKTAPAIDGSQWAGMRTPQRDLTLPLYIHESTSMGWRATDAAFFAAVAPDGECQLVVVTPNQQTRTLLMRYTDGGDAAYDVDPLLLQYAAYPATFTAADPYWQGLPVTRSFLAVDALAFFPGPPWNIYSSSTLASGTENNPGDVPSWAQWTITGPCTGFSVGIGGSAVSSSVPLAAGATVTIDADPGQLTILHGDGSDAWADMDAVDFEPIPPGVDVPLTMTATGEGAGFEITLTYTPKYRRAW